MSKTTARAGATRSARTYVPSSAAEADAQRFAEVLDSMAAAPGRRPALVGPHNEQIPLPPDAFEVLVQVAEAMRRGLAVQVAPLNAQLTTQEAADYLGVSRPTLVKLLESDAIPFVRPGRHRYVRLDDLMEYADRVRRRRADALDSLARESEAHGEYRDLDGLPPTMR